MKFEPEMKVEQLYTACLAQGTYYITSGNEAAIIDPLREIDAYLARAKNDGVTIKYILETHFHADFVSGHLDLAKATGATIVYGPTAKPAFPAHVAKDGELLPLGNAFIQVIHTPGHTMESSCFLLLNEELQPQSVFTGDTLFLGDVGRPDLAQNATGMSSKQLASLLFHSLRNKIMTLPNQLVIYPGHGAGSACGKNMSKETLDTLENQKKVNYALRENMSENEFVTEVLGGLTTPPAYFPQNAQMNKWGYDSIYQVLERGMTYWSAFEFEHLMKEKSALVIDSRNAEVFAQGHIPGSINIGLNGSFAPWAGALIKDVNTPLLLVCEADQAEETLIRLARVGFDKVFGCLSGGFSSWLAAGFKAEQFNSITPQQMLTLLEVDKNLKVIDVRKIEEYQQGHLTQAIHIPLIEIEGIKEQVKFTDPLLVYCQGGYRSMIALSILRKMGFQNLVDVQGGWNSIAPLLTKNSKLHAMVS